MNIQELITEHTKLVISMCEQCGMTAQQTKLAIHEDLPLKGLRKAAVEHAMLNTIVQPIYIDKCDYFGEDYQTEKQS